MEDLDLEGKRRVVDRINFLTNYLRREMPDAIVQEAVNVIISGTDDMSLLERMTVGMFIASHEFPFKEEDKIG